MSTLIDLLKRWAVLEHTECQHRLGFIFVSAEGPPKWERVAWLDEPSASINTTRRDAVLWAVLGCARRRGMASEEGACALVDLMQALDFAVLGTSDDCPAEHALRAYLATLPAPAEVPA